MDIIKKTNISSLKSTFLVVSFDINKDGFDDLIIGREDGVFLYKNNGNLQFTKIKIMDIKAKIVLDTGTRKYYREIIQGGHCFGSDQSNVVSFGLGKYQKVKEIRVYTIYGKQYKVVNPKINSTVVMKKIK